MNRSADRAARVAWSLIVPVLIALAGFGPACRKSSDNTGGSAAPAGPAGAASSTAAPASAPAQPSAHDAALAAQVTFTPTQGPCPIRSVKAAAVSPPSADRNQVLLTPHFVLDTDQQIFDHPVTITLPLDLAKLPPGAKAQDAYPVLARGGLCERLKAPVTVGADGRSISFPLTRVLPMVNAQFSEFSELSQEMAAAAVVDGSQPVRLSSSGIREIHALGRLAEEGKKRLPLIEQALDLAEQKLKAIGFDLPAQYTVMLTSLGSLEALTLGANDIKLNMDLMTKDQPSATDPWWTGIIVHEFFHLVQQTAKEANYARKAKGPRNVDPGQQIWLEESTAEFMAATLVPGYAKLVCKAVNLEIGYRSLLAGANTQAAQILAGQTFLFFSFLNTIYDAPDLVRQVFWLFCNDQQLPANASYANLMWEPPAVLEMAMKATPLRSGATARTLRAAYAEYLLRLYWPRDFDPANQLGSPWPQPGTLAMPRDSAGQPAAAHVQQWTLPEGEGAARVMERRCEVKSPSQAGPFRILRAYHINSAVNKSDETKTSLVLSLTAPPGTDGLALVAFPIKDSQAQSPLLGSQRIKIPDWHKLGAAHVWVIDTRPKDTPPPELLAKVELPPNEVLAVHWNYGDLRAGKTTWRGVAAGETVTTQNPQHSFIVFYPVTPTTGSSDNRDVQSFGLYWQKQSPRILAANRLPIPIRVKRLPDGPVVFGAYKNMSGIVSPPQVTCSLRPGRQDLLVEALGPDGSALASVPFSVDNTWQPGRDNLPGVLENIAKERAKPEPNAKWLFDMSLGVVEAHLDQKRDAEAWAAVVALEASAASMPELQQDHYLRFRFKAGLARGDLKATVEACEKMIALYSGAKPNKAVAARWYEELAGVWMSLDGNYAKAKQAWLQRNQLSGESKEWPYWPPLKDVP